MTVEQWAELTALLDKTLSGSIAASLVCLADGQAYTYVRMQNVKPEVDFRTGFAFISEMERQLIEVTAQVVRGSAGERYEQHAAARLAAKESPPAAPESVPEAPKEA